MLAIEHNLIGYVASLLQVFVAAHLYFCKTEGKAVVNVCQICWFAEILAAVTSGLLTIVKTAFNYS